MSTGGAVLVSDVARSRRDDLGGSIVYHLARLWTKHTKLRPSPSPDAPFLMYVSRVLSDCTDWDGTNPRRLIETAKHVQQGYEIRPFDVH